MSYILYLNSTWSRTWSSTRRWATHCFWAVPGVVPGGDYRLLENSTLSSTLSSTWWWASTSWWVVARPCGLGWGLEMQYGAYTASTLIMGNASNNFGKVSWFFLKKNNCFLIWLDLYSVSANIYILIYHHTGGYTWHPAQKNSHLASFVYRKSINLYCIVYNLKHHQTEG